MPKKKKVGGAGRVEEGVHARRTGRKLAAGTPGWPTRAAPLAPYAPSESEAPAPFGPLPRRAAVFLRLFFVAAPLPPMPSPSAAVAVEALPGSPSASGESGSTAEGATQQVTTRW